MCLCYLNITYYIIHIHLHDIFTHVIYTCNMNFALPEIIESLSKNDFELIFLECMCNTYTGKIYIQIV